MIGLDAWYRQARRITPVAFFVPRAEAEASMGADYAKWKKREDARIARNLKRRKPRKIAPEVLYYCHCHKEKNSTCNYMHKGRLEHNCCGCGCCIQE